MCYHNTSRLDVREYLDASGHSPFAAWSDRLNREAAAKVAAALARMQQGNLSNAKGVGSGVFEHRIDFGPGYRIYFGKDGQQLVILLGEGRKKASRRISPPHRRGGRTTSKEKGQRGDVDGIDARFQRNDSGAGEARSWIPEGVTAGRNRKFSSG